MELVRNKLIAITLILGVGAIGLYSYSTAYHIAPTWWGSYQPYDCEKGLALAGYDPVAYLRNHTAREGDTDEAVMWEGAEWHFTSRDNRKLFEADPVAYAPQFGGHCANSVSSGWTCSANPQIWYVYEQKLYLFSDEKAKQQWVNQIPDGIIEKAEANWKN